MSTVSTPDLSAAIAAEFADRPPTPKIRPSVARDLVNSAELIRVVVTNSKGKLSQATVLKLYELQMMWSLQNTGIDQFTGESVNVGEAIPDGIADEIFGGDGDEPDLPDLVKPSPESEF